MVDHQYPLRTDVFLRHRSSPDCQAMRDIRQITTMCLRGGTVYERHLIRPLMEDCCTKILWSCGGLFGARRCVYWVCIAQWSTDRTVWTQLPKVADAPPAKRWAGCKELSQIGSKAVEFLYSVKGRRVWFVLATHLILCAVWVNWKSRFVYVVCIT